jgi:hypothetical protein
MLEWPTKPPTSALMTLRVIFCAYGYLLWIANIPLQPVKQPDRLAELIAVLEEWFFSGKS